MLPHSKNIYVTYSDSSKHFYATRGIKPGSFRLQHVSEDYIYIELKSVDPKQAQALIIYLQKQISKMCKSTGPSS